MTKSLKKFVPGSGYTREDWDAVDSPKLTDEEIAALRPAREVLPRKLFEALTTRQTEQKTPPKTLVSLQIDLDILERFQSEGPDWQSKINDALRKVVMK